MTLRGAYGGAGPDGLGRLASLDKWVGVPTAVMGDGLARDNWSNCNSVCDWAAQGWAKTTRLKAVSIPLCMSADAGGYDLAGAAAGAYDASYTKICNTIASRRVGNLVLRPGWEFNGGWYGWGVNAPPSWTASAARAQLFIPAFQRFVTIARKVLPGALIDWNGAAGSYGVPTQNFYPGDAYVDLIGTDIYDVIDPDQPAMTDAQRWTFHRTRANGLDWLATFAAAHKKPISIPEWGCGYKKATSGTANVSRDSALFVTNMAAWIATHNVYYHCYFHYPAPDGQWQLGTLWSLVPGTQTPAKTFPAASAAYLTAYGVTKMATQLDTDYTALGIAITAYEQAQAAIATAQGVVTAAQADLAAKRAAMIAAAQAVAADAAAA